MNAKVKKVLRNWVTVFDARVGKSLMNLPDGLVSLPRATRIVEKLFFRASIMIAQAESNEYGERV